MQRLHHFHQHQSSSCGYNVTRMNIGKVNLDEVQVHRMRSADLDVISQHLISILPRVLRQTLRTPGLQIITEKPGIVLVAGVCGH